MLNKLLIKVIISSFILCLSGCKEKDFVTNDHIVTYDNETKSSAKIVTSKDKEALEASFKEFSSLFLPFEDKLIINKSSFENFHWNKIPSGIATDWIPIAEIDIEKKINFDNWLALVMGNANTGTFFCMANVAADDIRIYLLRIDQKSEPKMEYLGSIFEYNYTDASEEEGEKYEFEVSECESLHLEFIGDSLYTSCDRYSTTIGKDWRVDQNLYVNDTVKLPSIDKTYSLY